MILLEEGFKIVNREWKECANMPQSKVEEMLSKECPCFVFKVFTPEKFKICSEEFYYNQIALVVDATGNVVLPPKFFGSEPDFEKIASPIGKDGQTVCAEISDKMPSVKVVMKNKDGRQKWSNKEATEHYVSVKVDQNDKVCEKPTYIRVQK